MQRSEALTRGHLLVLCAIAGLALIQYGPGAWSAACSHARTPYGPLAGSSLPRLDLAAPVALLDWQETASPAMTLVTLARQESAQNNKSVQELRALLHTQKTGSLDYALTLQSLLLAAAQRDAWDSTWRKLGRHGADLRQLSRSLMNLRIEFLGASASLQSLQATERNAASVFSFTPPVF